MVHHRRVARIGLAALFLFAGCARAEDAGAGAGEPGRGADSDDAQPSPDHEELVRRNGTESGANHARLAPCTDARGLQAKPEFVEPMAEVAAMLETFQSDPFASGRWVKSAKAKYTAQAVAIGQGAKGSAFEGDQVRAGRAARGMSAATDAGRGRRRRAGAAAEGGGQALRRRPPDARAVHHGG